MSLMDTSFLVARKPPPPPIEASWQKDSPSLPPITVSQTSLLCLADDPSPMQNLSLSVAQVADQHSEQMGQKSGLFLGTQQLKSPNIHDFSTEQFGTLLGVQNDYFRETSPADELNSRFIVTTNHRETLRFIEANDLTHVLLDSVKHVNAAFGESSLKTLALVEDDEGFQSLFCLVIFPGTLQDARTALKSFDNAWWLQHARQFGSKLNFDFELA